MKWVRYTAIAITMIVLGLVVVMIFPSSSKFADWVLRLIKSVTITGDRAASPEHYRGFWVARYEVGKGWGAPEQIQVNGQAQSVAIDDAGNSVAIWHNSRSEAGIWFNNYRVGTTWSVPKRLVGGKDYITGGVAMNGTGSVIVLWHHLEEYGKVTDKTHPPVGVENIWASYYLPGQGWSAPIRIDAGLKQLRVFRVVMDNQGNAIVVWGQFGDDYGIRSIWISRYRRDKGWTEPAKIDGALGETPFRTSLVDASVDQRGNILTVWDEEEDDRGPNYRIWANWAVEGKRWGTPTKITTGHGVPKPQVAMDENGNAMVVWEHLEGQDYSKDSHIWASRYISGTGWSKPTQIDANIGGAGNPRVAVDASGNAMAVWHKFDRDIGIGFKVYAARYVVGKGWEAPILLTTPGKHGLFPDVAVNSRGDAIVIWQPDTIP